MKLKNFTPNDINLEDDASHLKEEFGRIETWYYDAIFENGYSLVSLINVLHIGRFGIVLTGLFLYKDKKPIKIIRNRYRLSKFKSNENILSINLKNNVILKTSNSDNNEWKTNLTINEEDVKINLDFFKKSRGFKGETYLGKWLAIPKMEIKGSINIDNKNFELNGSGYHDHNIYPIYAPFKTRGYYFGKIDLETNHLTWARVIKNKKNQQLLSVLSKKNEYYNIPQKSIKYNIINEITNHRKKIPNKFSLKINDKKIKINLKIQPINYHYIGVLIANYWRYHVRYKGEIEIDSIKKTIDTVEITEYLKFF